MNTFDIPIHLPKQDFLLWLSENKTRWHNFKRYQVKDSDGIAFIGSGAKVMDPKGFAVKAQNAAALSSVSDVLQVKAAINTTNWFDSHGDVHIPGLWKKNLSESADMIVHLQEHEMSFKNIIADGEDLKVGTRKSTFKELGFDYPGTTEILGFDSIVRKSRNSFMHEQYAAGRVKNHSVRMVYVKYVLCVNEPDNNAWGAEYEAWQKYISYVANKEDAEASGYMWAVLEAKIIEGSAVVRGSNVVTPTMSVSSKSEPPTEGTQEPEPERSTQKQLLEALKTKNIFL